MTSESDPVSSVFKACARAPLSPASQHDLISWRYAPLPSNLPVGSIFTPSGVRTIRIRDRFASTCLQPTHVRCGICLTRGFAFLTILPTNHLNNPGRIFLNPDLGFPSFAGTGAFVFLARDGKIPIRIVFDLDVFAAFFLCLLISIIHCGFAFRRTAGLLQCSL